MPKLLIVDDEPLVRRSLQKTLERKGFDVDTAEDCNSGLASFESAETGPQPYDLAILDLNMPCFDGRSEENAGLDLMKKLHLARPGLPVVFLTAYDAAGKAKTAVQKGAVGYWVKGREQGLPEFLRQVLESRNENDKELS